MGTRCLTFVYDDNFYPIVNMYRQFDGYPAGHGRELAEFLSSFDAIVNGYQIGDKRKIANGIGCLAAQMIAHFKVGVGGIYLHPTTNDDLGQEYEYHVYGDSVKVVSDNRILFSGFWPEFYEWTSEKETV